MIWANLLFCIPNHEIMITLFKANQNKLEAQFPINPMINDEIKNKYIKKIT
jgi:1,2-phenylacetyl-CoA epoxidase catalytic subunit